MYNTVKSMSRKKEQKKNGYLVSGWRGKNVNIYCTLWFEPDVRDAGRGYVGGDLLFTDRRTDLRRDGGSHHIITQ